MSDPGYSNFVGSGAANVATGLLFLLGWLLKNKCRHCQCESRTFCCRINVNDDASESEKDTEGDIEQGHGEIRSRQGTCRFSRQIAESLQEMFAGKHIRVLKERKKIIQIGGTRRNRTSDDESMA